MFTLFFESFHCGQAQQAAQMRRCRQCAGKLHDCGTPAVTTTHRRSIRTEVEITCYIHIQTTSVVLMSLVVRHASQSSVRMPPKEHLFLLTFIYFTHYQTHHHYFFSDCPVWLMFKPRPCVSRYTLLLLDPRMAAMFFAFSNSLRST